MKAQIQSPIIKNQKYKNAGPFENMSFSKKNRFKISKKKKQKKLLAKSKQPRGTHGS